MCLKTHTAQLHGLYAAYASHPQENDNNVVALGKTGILFYLDNYASAEECVNRAKELIVLGN